jgi:antitoxin CcdA
MRMKPSVTPATRKATNVSLDAQVIADARDLGINISKACEQGLVAEISKARAERWQRENADAIADWNRWVEKNGLPLAKYRMF